MKNSKAVKAYLIISGILLLFLGCATLFVPVGFKLNSGIDISNNINLINDARAFGALLLATSLTSLYGIFVPKVTFSSVLFNAILFFSLGVGRLLSILLDGMPVEGLVKATGLEIILGLVGSILLFTQKNK